jgi:hypothetical protein
MAVPYFVLYARDLVQSGYRLTDAVRAYALNLLLLPVNLAGVWKSVRPGLTGKKAPFGRTPKVADRTAVPASYLVSELVLIAVAAVVIAADCAAGRWAHAGFAVLNGGLLLYGFHEFIGTRATVEDLGLPESPAWHEGSQPTSPV